MEEMATIVFGSEMANVSSNSMANSILFELGSEFEKYEETMRKSRFPNRANNPQKIDLVCQIRKLIV